VNVKDGNHTVWLPYNSMNAKKRREPSHRESTTEGTLSTVEIAGAEGKQLLTAGVT
jgi:hypothetical protein